MSDAEIVVVESEGVRWEVAASRRGLFDELLEDRVEEIFARGDELLKSNSARSIAIVRGGGDSLVVKKYHSRGPIANIRRRVGNSQARQEWLNLHKARAAGVRVPEPVAMGAGGRCEYLATIEVAGARPLIEILRRGGEADARRGGLMARLAGLCAEMHDAGIVHRDLHLGNFLVSGDSGDLVLIDLHRAKFVERVERRDAARDLGQLMYSLSLVAPKEIRAQLLDEYVRMRRIEAPNFAEAAWIEARMWGRRHQRRRTRRCLKNSSTFVVEKSQSRRVYRRRDFDRDIDAILDAHCRALESGEGVLKDAPKSRLTVVDGEFVVKEHASGIRGAQEASALGGLRGSRLKREWVNANGLIVRGLRAAEPLAYVEKGLPSPLGGRRTWLISRFLKDATPLDAFLRERFEGEGARHGDKARVIKALAAEVARLHGADILHKDMKANNIMVRDGGDGIEFYFLDLDRVRFGTDLGNADIVRALAALNAAVPNFITISDRILFFRTYRGGGKIERRDRTLIRDIVIASIKRNHFWRPKWQR